MHSYKFTSKSSNNCFINLPAQRMSQFDYPRINFFGKTVVNPPTANNNSLLPLVVYDPVNVQVVIPPRIYISNEISVLLNSKQLSLPEQSALIKDGKGDNYFEISSVDNDEKLKKWLTTPLGESALDREYHSLYGHIKTLKNQQPLKGQTPAGWNYFGGMDFAFKDVRVCSITILNKNNEVETFGCLDQHLPEKIDEILNASVTLENEKGDDAATMVDVIPGLSFYSQIFFHFLKVSKRGNTLLKGKPMKASLRFLNINRILGQEGLQPSERNSCLASEKASEFIRTRWTSGGGRDCDSFVEELNNRN